MKIVKQVAKCCKFCENYVTYRCNTGRGKEGTCKLDDSKVNCLMYCPHFGLTTDKRATQYVRGIVNKNNKEWYESK